ncbi:hypothetical protein VSR01_15590 [Actinacidiphila sp. DG2A-62]|uniref:hypothetical protein n=1 Tax=Actinacidiphila sp. DG2A-62 TaxID=3108821 RepID=UPI002DB9BFF2|nr:hypothetical protein [Actinacidiphila sp. DG2A-62]MEC3994873.1 hypothetical protein [Actinacidiphila sp. DG2A-62]
MLADSYQEVVVVDRDRLLGVREPRTGAPHNVHAHGLLARGHMIMEELFPGITDELSRTGVPTYDIGEIHWYFTNRRVRLADTGLLSVASRRPVLEAHLRARVAARANVVFLEEHDILEPTATADGTRVTGVKVRPPAGPAGRRSARWRRTWWWTPPAAARAPRPGWRRWATSAPRKSAYA